jgi:hypothetical protein
VRALHAATLAAALVAFVPARPVAAVVFMTQKEALAEAFPNARIERRALVMDSAQVSAVEQRARVRVTSRLAVAYRAWRGDSLAGTAFFDTRTVRTMPAIFMVVIAPDHRVRRVDILAFHEPPDYQPGARWLGQFEGRPLDDELWPERGIRMLAGATLSSRAITDATRLALALEQLLPPAERASDPNAAPGARGAK